MIALDLWKMLLPFYDVLFAAEDKQLWQVLCLCFVAEILPNYDDVLWQKVSHCGRCFATGDRLNSHLRVGLF